MSVATATHEVQVLPIGPALDVIAANHHPTTPELAPASDSVLSKFNPAELARLAHVTVMGAHEKLESTRTGRMARRLGIVGGVAVAGTLLFAKAANAYTQVRYGAELGVPDVMHVSIPDPGDTVDVDTIGGRNVDMNQYTAGDNTRTVISKDTLPNFAKDDLAVAARTAGVDDAHIDDLIKNPLAVDYVVDGYTDDTGNKGEIGKNGALKNGTEIETDAARARAQEVAVNLNILESKLDLNAKDSLNVKITDQKIDLADYVSNQRTADAWRTSGDSAWNWAEQDLALAGKMRGLTDQQIQDLIDNNIRKVTNTYIKSNDSIQNHSSHYLITGQEYDATAARKRADELAMQFLQDLEDTKSDSKDKNTNLTAHTTGHGQSRDTVSDDVHENKGVTSTTKTIYAEGQGQSRYPYDIVVDHDKRATKDPNATAEPYQPVHSDKQGQARYPMFMDHDERAAKELNATAEPAHIIHSNKQGQSRYPTVMTSSKPWPIPNTDASTSPQPVETGGPWATPTVDASEAATVHDHQETDTKENKNVIGKAALALVGLGAAAVAAGQLIRTRIARHRTAQPTGEEHSPVGQDPGPGDVPPTI